MKCRKSRLIKHTLGGGKKKQFFKNQKVIIMKEYASKELNITQRSALYACTC